MDTRLTTTLGVWWLVVAVVALALLMAQGATSASAASPTACRVQNTDSRKTYQGLQAAVDAARSGQTLTVRGTCVGEIVIGKNLVIQGVRTERYGKPKLSGAGPQVDVVLRVKHGRVKLRSLEIMRGDGGYGSGLYIHGNARVVLRDVLVHGNRSRNASGAVANWGTLVMNGSTRVSQNRATGNSEGIEEASGVLNFGILIMNDTSAISGNVGRAYGGGAWNDGTLIMNDSSAIHGNGVISAAGGVWINEGSTLTMNDSSSIKGNTSGEIAGGVYNWGTLTMNDASTVSGNTATKQGGGVSSGGTLILHDTSSIHDNTSDLVGGGVSLFTLSGRTPPTLTMTGASNITGNAAASQGGGIHVDGQASLSGVSCAPHTYANVYGNNPDDCHFE